MSGKGGGLRARLDRGCPALFCQVCEDAHTQTAEVLRRGCGGRIVPCAWLCLRWRSLGTGCIFRVRVCDVTRECDGQA